MLDFVGLAKFELGLSVLLDFTLVTISALSIGFVKMLDYIYPDDTFLI